MLLTAVEPRRHGLMALFLDGEDAVRVDAETLAQSGLKPGMELSDEQLHELLRQSDAHRAGEKALYLLEHRSHAKKELTDKIARTLPREAAQAAADKMERLGLLDDADYAQRLTRELYRKGAARRKVLWELRQKGIDPQLAQQAAEQDAPQPLAAALALLQRRYPAGGDEKARRRAAALLQRMGYEGEDIRAALRAYFEGEDGWDG